MRLVGQMAARMVKEWVAMADRRGPVAGSGCAFEQTEKQRWVDRELPRREQTAARMPVDQTMVAQTLA